MEHPIFRMRAKVASKMNTHAFDDRVMELLPEQLFTLYLQYNEEDKQQRHQELDLLKTLNKVWSEHLTNLFDELKLFVNPDMFKRLLELKKTKIHREEINEENFAEIWSEIAQMIPSEYVEQSADVISADLPSVDEETDRILAGWVPYTPKFERRD